MIKHVGLQVIEKDVDGFYSDILHFKIERVFALTEKETLEIFNMANGAKIYFGNCDGMELELFISDSLTSPTFGHVCFQTAEAPELAEKARKKGYRVFIRDNGKSETYFISDANHNLFEIKK